MSPLEIMAICAVERAIANGGVYTITQQQADEAFKYAITFEPTDPSLQYLILKVTKPEPPPTVESQSGQ